MSYFVGRLGNFARFCWKFSVKMFQVERWLGTEEESKKNVSPLSLDRLNAKARERAAVLNRGRNGSSSPAPVVSDKILNDDIESRRDEGNAEGPTDVITDEPNGVSVSAPEKQHQERKKHKELNVELPRSSGVEATDSGKKSRNRKKEKTSHGKKENDLSAETPNSPGLERKRKKVKKSVSNEANGGLSDSANPTAEVGLVKNSAELAGVSDSKTEKRKKKKKGKPEVGNLESAVATSHRRNDDGDESEPLAHGEDDDQDTLIHSSEELETSRTVGIPPSEPDFSTIERDVERILGRDNLAPAEPHDTRPVLQWMRDPIEIDSYRAVTLAQVPGLDIRLQEALTKTGIKTLFPVQMAVWYETVGPGLCEKDVCVSSPTGSGKTLSYALPLVQKLSSRVLHLLRALVVLPTRDLAAQVKAVFDTIAPAVGLSVGLAVGQTSITTEAAELVKFRKTMVHSFGYSEGSYPDLAESSVDILVATPGRLMDHLRNTKGFTLQHLQFLVVDETDRLLRQAYQDWLPNVLASVASGSRGSELKFSGQASRSFFSGSVRTTRRCYLERGDRGTGVPRLMKIVLSATLTRDPTKIAQLGLYRPIYVAPGTYDNRYQLPEQLKSFRMVCKPGEKPLYLVALLQQLCSQSTIVFTASVVATHRLYTLLSCFKGFSFEVVEYSSLQHQQARSKALEKFRNGKAQVLIASDAMTRGMDVEGVANVVNYDMPVYAKTYVHRVGRTARAGQAGSAYTLLRREEVRYFKLMLKKVDNSKCKDFFLPSSVTEGLYESYVEALEKLKQIAADEGASIPHGSRTKDGEQEVTGPDELFM